MFNCVDLIKTTNILYQIKLKAEQVREKKSHHA